MPSHVILAHCYRWFHEYYHNRRRRRRRRMSWGGKENWHRLLSLLIGLSSTRRGEEAETGHWVRRLESQSVRWQTRPRRKLVAADETVAACRWATVASRFLLLLIRTCRGTWGSACWWRGSPCPVCFSTGAPAPPSPSRPRTSAPSPAVPRSVPSPSVILPFLLLLLLFVSQSSVSSCLILLQSPVTFPSILLVVRFGCSMHRVVCVCQRIRPTLQGKSGSSRNAGPLKNRRDTDPCHPLAHHHK